jgi:beta-N-acetylhexosaminidase
MLDRRTLLAGLAGAGAQLALPGPSTAAGLETMIGQMLLLGFAGSDSQAPAAQRLARQVRAGEVGGVMMLGHNVKTREGIESLTRLFRDAAPALRPFIAADQEGGAVQRLSSKFGYAKLPGAQAVAQAMSPEAARGLYAKAGREFAEAGFNMNLAPVADLHDARNPVIGHWGRSYGTDPSVVARYAGAFVDGFRSAGVACVVKHFPGHGSSQGDSHKLLEDVTGAWRESELEPFRMLVRARQAPAIMLAHLHLRKFSDGDAPVTLSRAAIERELRGDLRFNGVVMTDDLDMAAIRSRYPLDEAAVRAVAAGADVIMLSNSAAPDPELPKRIAGVLLRAVESGWIPAARIVEAHERIKALKATLHA